MSLRVLTATAEGVEEFDAEAWGAGGDGSGRPSGVAEVLVVDRSVDADRLLRILHAHPSIRLVQLPSAGIDRWLPAIRALPELHWASARGAYARPVAEFALALTLAALRRLPERARARSWGGQWGESLYGRRVTVLGAGPIALEYLRLARPFDVRTTVVRRTATPVPQAEATVTAAALPEVLAHTEVLLLAAPATAATHRLIDAAALAALPRGAVLVNVARGELVDLEALADALESGTISAAALDVTDPEPLPPEHRLWRQPRCLITPHTANTARLAEPLLHERVAENLRRWQAGEQLLGVIDPAAGY